MYPKRRWRADEIHQLILRYPTEGPQSLMNDLRRSEDSINSQACHLRIKSLTRRLRQGQTRQQKSQATECTGNRAPDAGKKETCQTAVAGL
jgi:hypothetical protein